MKLHIVFFICLPGILVAQEHEDVFPNLSGNELIVQLQEAYTPDSVLSYGMGRDTLFRNIDSVNDTLFGVYTRHSVYLPPDEDPTQAAFMNGSGNGINTEHVWPRSKGSSSGNAESDLQHLYPTKTPVNSDRASLPFGEVDDFSTLKWYRKDQVESQIPNRNIDEYSELGVNFFEPREAFKGDIARSMFYFYTIYREEADQADPDFFSIQRADLCAWHLNDAVDATEWERTHQIAAYQSGKTNPFILDCTLAHRTYCQDFMECEPTSSITYSIEDFSFRVYPNPVSDILYIEKSIAHWTETYKLTLQNTVGDVVLQETLSTNSQLSILNLPEGLYILVLSNEKGKIAEKLYISRL